MALKTLTNAKLKKVYGRIRLNDPKIHVAGPKGDAWPTPYASKRYMWDDPPDAELLYGRKDIDPSPKAKDCELSPEDERILSMHRDNREIFSYMRRRMGLCL